MNVRDMKAMSARSARSIGVSGSGGIEFLSSWFALRFAARRESRDKADQLPGCLTACSMSVALVTFSVRHGLGRQARLAASASRSGRSCMYTGQFVDCVFDLVQVLTHAVARVGEVTRGDRVQDLAVFKIGCRLRREMLALSRRDCSDRASRIAATTVANTSFPEAWAMPRWNWLSSFTHRTGSVSPCISSTRPVRWASWVSVRRRAAQPAAGTSM